MKAKNKDPKSTGSEKTKASRRPSYYFHADEDFREDRDWIKNQAMDVADQKKQIKALP
ncbi:hypothetical protein [Pedobacter hiemivivus]|uniref:hypothetical protein n=1 Tax=Pedobacter hiemivivus TaxID=2530454 RepID=UPI0013F14858|nr:hypothetical protein [Pedobacter hiemivivus]